MSLEKEDKKPAKPREPRIYKGEVKPLADVSIGTVFQFMEREAIQGKPLFGILERVQPGFRVDELALTYRDPRGGMVPRVVYVKKTHPLNVLSGTQGTKIQTEYNEWRSKQPVPRFACSIGADPEIFVVDEHGAVIPAWLYLGSKSAPFKEHDRSKNTAIGNSVYWDGFQAEYDTPGGVTCLAYHCDYIHSGLKAVLQAARKVNPKAQLSIDSVLPVPMEILENGKEEHVQFGCMPSKNIYGLSGKKEDGRTVPYRFAGGHLHFGITPRPDSAAEARIIRHLDAILGVACVSLFAEMDVPVRREYYGLAGEYRTPPHGLEYRTLSNAWLCHPLVTNMVYELGRRAIAHGHGGYDRFKFKEEEVIMTIQTLDVERARRSLSDNSEALTEMMKQCFPGRHPELFTKLLQGPVSAFILDPKNLEKNWCLKSGWVGHCEVPNGNWVRTNERLALGEKV